MTNNGRLVFGTNGSAGQQTITTSASYRDGNYHHLVATQGPSGMALYVDGVLVGTNAATNGENINGYWRVGGDRVSGWPDAPSSSLLQRHDRRGRGLPEGTHRGEGRRSLQLRQRRRARRGRSDHADRPHRRHGRRLGRARAGTRRSTTSASPATRSTARPRSASRRAPTTLVGSPTGTAYTDTSAPAGIVYYRVLAQDAAGNLSDASIQYSVFVPDVVAPSAPGRRHRQRHVQLGRGVLGRGDRQHRCRPVRASTARRRRTSCPDPRTWSRPRRAPTSSTARSHSAPGTTASRPRTRPAT